MSERLIKIKVTNHPEYDAVNFLGWVFCSVVILGLLGSKNIFIIAVTLIWLVLAVFLKFKKDIPIKESFLRPAGFFAAIYFLVKYTFFN